MHAAGNHRYLHCIVAVGTATVCCAVDHRLVAALRSIVTPQDDPADRICSRIDLENQKSHTRVKHGE
jgi:hypothetical protein